MLSAEKVKSGPRFRDKAQPKRILVLDDDPLLREVAEPVLSGQGYDVLLMEDGLHDEKFFSKLRVDAAIIDLGLPGISGLEVIERLRATERGSNMPIFVVTGSTDFNEIGACYKDAGVALVLSKPVDWRLLLSELSEAFAAAK